jgi:putative PIN family toxin of toxin-antitoxin system
MRVVLDTNVLISAFVSSKGAPAQIFDLWRAGKLEIVTAQAAIDEIKRVLTYPRIRGRLRYSDEQVQQFLALLKAYAVFLEDLSVAAVVAADPDDDKFLALAIASQAQYVVSGDGHLLDVGVYQGVTIVTPAAFLAGFVIPENE